MSIDTCRRCSDPVDTDDDPAFYEFDYKTKSGYGGHCESCREEICDEMTEAEQDAHEKRMDGKAA